MAGALGGFPRLVRQRAEHPSQAKLLRAQARAAIPQLLAVVAALNERRSGRSDRSADFRTLALWFAQAPDDPSMHRLWRVAFGLCTRATSRSTPTRSPPARRTRSPFDTLGGRPAAADQPAAAADRQLRAAGQPNRVTDRAEHRDLLRQLAAREAAETARRERAGHDRSVRLCELGKLEGASFGLFLGLLGDALGPRRPGRREVTTTTCDGTMRVRLTPDGDARAAIRTPAGCSVGPDHLVEIIDLAVPATAGGRGAVA